MIKICNYKKLHNSPLKKCTLCFLFTKDSILLALKKRGFGEGKLNGVGGKLQKNEKVISALKREAFEEIGVVLEKTKRVAVLDFYFLNTPGFNQKVIVYVALEWKNIPQESEEVNPKWFKKTKIPFQKMWPDDKYWLPLVLSGYKVRGEFLFGNKDKILDLNIKKLGKY